VGSPYPILNNGLGLSQGIMDVSTTAIVNVGTRATLPDGRSFYYARQSSATALVAGNILQAQIAGQSEMDNIVTGTGVVGDLAIDLTPTTGKTYTANELAEGYLCVDTATTGAGTTYKIRSHPAVVDATLFSCTLYDALQVAVSSDATTTVIKNPWMDAIIGAATIAYMPVGVSNVAVPAGDTTARYYWCQTWGIAAVTAGESTASGGLLMTDNSGTAGRTQLQTAGAAIVGVNMFTASDGTFCPVFLKIAP
jgi:hypothetical protein